MDLIATKCEHNSKNTLCALREVAVDARGVENVEVAGEQPVNNDEFDTGFGIEDPGLQSPKEVGRVYELKKIYARLISIETFLASKVDKNLSNVRELVSQSIELFNTLISNVDLYKDMLDKIIILYYKFIDSVYTNIKQYMDKRRNT